jgi:hypothetical protein
MFENLTSYLIKIDTGFSNPFLFTKCQYRHSECVGNILQFS